MEGAGLLAMAAPLAGDPWSARTWQDVLGSLKGQPIAVAAAWYERALKLFPTAAAVWLPYLEATLEAGDAAAVNELLGRALRLCFDVAIWQFYVEYLLTSQLQPAETALSTSKAQQAAATTAAARNAAETAVATAASAYAEARANVRGAFDYAFSHVGTSPHAGPLWEAFIAFLQGGPEGTAYEGNVKRDDLRAAYTRALAVPHASADKLWDEYCEFERVNSQEKLAGVLIGKVAAAAGTSKAVAGERARVWGAADRDALAVPPPPVPPTPLEAAAAAIAAAGAAGGVEEAPPSLAATAAAAAVTNSQVAAWRRIIVYELSNPALLPVDKHVECVRYAFAQALAALRFCPDIWADYAAYETEVHAAAAAAAAGTPAAALGDASILGSAVAAEAPGVDGLPLAESVAVCVYRRALPTNPTSCLLAYHAADYLEQRKKGDAAAAVYSSLIKALATTATAPAPSAAAAAAAADASAAASASAAGGDDGPSLTALLATIDALPLASLETVGEATLASLPTPGDRLEAAAALPGAFIQQMRFARRTGGVLASRAIFTQARSTPHAATPQLFLAAAHGEYYGNRELEVARKIIELGRKKHPKDLAYALSALDFLCAVDDSTNVRAFFEATLAELSPVDSRPVFDRYIHYELRRAQGGGSLAAAIALEQRRAVVHPHLVGPHARLLLRGLHRYAEYGDLPAATRVDADLALRRHPCHPYAGLPTSAAASATAGGGGPSYLGPAAWATVCAASATAAAAAAASSSGSAATTPTAAAGASPAAFSGGEAGAAVRRALASVRDGLFPQHLPGVSGPLAHVPPQYTQPARGAIDRSAAAAASAAAVMSGVGSDESHLSSSSSATGAHAGSIGSAEPPPRSLPVETALASLPPAVSALLARMPAFDASEPVPTATDVATAIATLLQAPIDGASASGSGAGAAGGGGSSSAFGGKQPKSLLQEILQKTPATGDGAVRTLPEYRLVQQVGPDNLPTFTVECTIAAYGLKTLGTGNSIRTAEHDAAAAMLRRLSGAASDSAATASVAGVKRKITEISS